MKTIIITEGKTKIETPQPENFRTRAGDYAPSLTKVFYNPLMEFCRDISISVAQTAARRFNGLRVCDPLAGVGVRGIRYANEVKGVTRAVVNDFCREAFELIRKNVTLNGLTDLIETRSTDANILLRENRGQFSFVDLDPFGSPAPFLDAACSSLGKRGMLALTATDTAPLSGTHVKTCLRRYGARPLRTEYCHETGIRILIGFAQRLAGLHEMALTPVLAHATQHYFRIYLAAERGAQRADEVLKKIGYLSHCSSCLRRSFTSGVATALPQNCECGEKLSHAGPLWLGNLIDGDFTREVLQDLSLRDFRLKHQELSLLSRCLEEAEGPPTFYDLNELAGREKKSPPKMKDLLTRIRDRGYFASRTHFSPTGFRTDAPLEEILELIGTS